METPAVARRLVKPLVGEENWTFLHDVKTSLGTARTRRAERRANNPRTLVLSEDQVLARAEDIVAERQRRELAAMSTNLTALAKHFDTDKWGSHRYTPHYQHHLARLRDKPIRLLEIGIGGYSRSGQGGASLRMWKHYFPNGQIVGLDISDKKHVEEDRIRVFQGDQSDPDLLLQVNAEAGPFDIIIDDGSHRPAHILASFATLFPLLADTGIYVVEDTQTSYWPEWGGEEDRDATGTSMAMLKRLCDGVNYMEFVDESYEPTYEDLHVVAVHFYHNLVFVQKGDNNETTRRRKILRKRYAEPETSGNGASTATP